MKGNSSVIINNKESLDWLRYCISKDNEKPSITDWYKLLCFLRNHTIESVCFPHSKDPLIPKELYIKWMGLVQLISDRNAIINRRIVEAVSFLEDAGFKCVLLKGQGNAVYYPVASCRVPGDIDLWIDENRENLYCFIRRHFPNASINRKHIKLPLFNDTEIDVHYTPLKFYSHILNKRFNRWVKCDKVKLLSEKMILDGNRFGIIVPTSFFNVIYLLGHIQIHLIENGVGLRQIIDYYYLLKSLDVTNTSEKDDIVSVIRNLRLDKIASAIMWIMKDNFGLSDVYLIMPTNKILGELVFEDIIEGGNFGKMRRVKGFQRSMRLLRLMPVFPFCEFFARVTNRIYNSIQFICKLTLKAVS